MKRGKLLDRVENISDALDKIGRISDIIDSHAIFGHGNNEAVINFRFNKLEGRCAKGKTFRIPLIGHVLNNKTVLTMRSIDNRRNGMNAVFIKIQDDVVGSAGYVIRK